MRRDTSESGAWRTLDSPRDTVAENFRFPLWLEAGQEPQGAKSVFWKPSPV